MPSRFDQVHDLRMEIRDRFAQFEEALDDHLHGICRRGYADGLDVESLQNVSKLLKGLCATCRNAERHPEKPA